MIDVHHEERVSPLSSDDKMWFRGQFHCVWVPFPAGILSLWFLGKKRVLNLQGQRGSPVWLFTGSPQKQCCSTALCHWVGEPSITHDTEVACFLLGMGLGGSQTCTHFLCFRLVLSRKTSIWFQVGICLSYLLLFKWEHGMLDCVPVGENYSALCHSIFCDC